MLRRMYVTEGQLRELNESLGNDASPGGGSPAVASDQDATIRVAPAAPKAQLSVGELKRQQGGLPAQPVAAAAQQPASAPAPQRQPVAAPAATPAPAPAPAATGGNTQIPTTLPGLLRLARHWNASDLHISVGRPPFVRLGGLLRYLETAPLTSEGAEELVFSCLTPEQVVQAREQQQLDFALEIPKVGRHLHPANGIGWKLATDYAAWLSQETGQVYRLPTEAEWENAARVGTSIKFPWGNNDPAARQAQYGGNGTVAVLEMSNGRNNWDLLHMAGNVQEWCLDWYSEKTYELGDQENPRGPASVPTDEGKPRRVVRGGGFLSDTADEVRTTRRNRLTPDKSDPDLGFRLVRETK